MDREKVRFAHVNNHSTFLLRHLLDLVLEMETPPFSGDLQEMYEARNRLLLRAVGAAAVAGISVGFRLDPKEPEWPVVYFELPTGQVSWHLPQHPKEWDGHDTLEKFERIRRWLS